MLLPIIQNQVYIFYLFITIESIKIRRKYNRIVKIYYSWKVIWDYNGSTKFVKEDKKK